MACDGESAPLCFTYEGCFIKMTQEVNLELTLMHINAQPVCLSVLHAHQNTERHIFFHDHMVFYLYLIQKWQK